MNRILISCIFLLVPSLSFADEGLFAPHQIDTLPNSKSVVGSVIRVRPLIKFDVHVFENQQEKDAFKKLAGANDKKFLAEGGSAFYLNAVRN